MLPGGRITIVHAQTLSGIHSPREHVSIRCVDGGYGSLLLGSRFSNVYGKIVAFGGAFIIHDVAIGNPGVLGNADVRYFRRVFGDFSTLEGSERDPLWHVQKAVKENRMSPVLLLCGTNDLLFHSNERMCKELHKMGVPAKLIPIVNGDHTWICWNSCMEQTFTWLVDDSSLM